VKDRLRILDIWVDPVTREGAIRWVAEVLRNGKKPHSIFASNPEKNFSVPKDRNLYKVFEGSDLLLPDGVGMVIAARILYGAKIERIPGADFMEDICHLASQEGHKIFIYGAVEEVNRQSSEILQIKFPGLVIAGRANGYLGEDQMPDLIKQINNSRAEVLFLALGSPKQENWYGTYGKALEYIKIVQGIGGTLDTITGRVKRAPEVWRRHSAEWLYRLLKEPKRLGRQTVLPIFFIKVLFTKFDRMLRLTEKK
jgi:N-acetylglucosaminyldiphosphoundecaprenol N-acetyl-beta-D-mannosaminyltransferase